jgi:proline dehydrogenase
MSGNATNKARLYLPYGKEWYLYLCHRLAEFQQKILQASVDMAVA